MDVDDIPLYSHTHWLSLTINPIKPRAERAIHLLAVWTPSHAM